MTTHISSLQLLNDLLATLLLKQVPTSDPFMLVISCIIDIINKEQTRKIDKNDIIIHLERNNFTTKLLLRKGSEALSKQLKIPKIATNKLLKCIEEYYDFICTVLSTVTCIEQTTINKQVLIKHIISNKLTQKSFRLKNKNVIIQQLTQHCEIPTLIAHKIYSNISRQIGSKFILKTNESIEIVYSFGLKYWYKKWRAEFGNTEENIAIQAHYPHFKDELIDAEGKVQLTVNRWNKETEIAIKNQEKQECKQQCTTTQHALAFSIKSNTIISIEHLIALQLYCNTTTEQRKLSESYRLVRYNEGNSERIDDTIEDIAKEHTYYANWGRLLYEAVNVFGNRPWEQRFFYHRIDREMLFRKTTFVFIYAPLSTTADMNVAIDNFANEDGMIIKVDGTMNNCFDCQWISDCENETDFLFIGSKRPFSIDNVWLYRNSWISLEHYMSAINEIIGGCDSDSDDEAMENTLDKEGERSIAEKLLSIRDEIKVLSSDELHASLHKYACGIVQERYCDDEARLSAVGWIVKLFHCYLTQN